MEGNVALLPMQRVGASGERLLRFLVGVASLGGFLFGYDTGVVSGAMIKIVKRFDLNPFEHEMVVSSTIALAAVGAACSGKLNDLLGRRLSLIIGCFVFTLGALLMAIADSYETLLVGRMVVGYAVGISSSTVPQYIAELAPPARRGVLVSINNAAIVTGQVCASLVDGALSNMHDGWRLMLGLGGVPSLVMLAGLTILPESPRWLVTKGRMDAAKRVLWRLREGQPEVGAAVEEEFNGILDSLADEGVMPTHTRDMVALSTGRVEPSVDLASHRTRKSFSELFRDLLGLWRQLLLGLGLMVLQQIIGINTIMYYSGEILKQAHVGSDETVIWLTAPVASGQLVGCLLGMSLIDKHGRRPLVLASLAGVVISLGLEGAVFAVEEWYCHTDMNAVSGDIPLSEQQDGICGAAGVVLLVGMIFYLLSFGVGMSAIPWTVNSEIYPMRLRSLCMGFATAVNWIANLVVAATFLTLESAITRPMTFWLYGSFATIGFIFLALYMPETAQKKLEDIEKIFLPSPRASANYGNTNLDGEPRR